MIISHEAVQSICSLAEQLSGARIDFELSSVTNRTSINMWFKDLGRPRSPIIIMRPSGIKRHVVGLKFGTNAKPTIRQIEESSTEAYGLANLLIASTEKYCEIESSFDLTSKWIISDPNFKLNFTRKSISNPLTSDAFNFTCRKIVVPLLAALAELIGYEEDQDLEPTSTDGELEGALLKETVLKRERSRKNRYLSLEYHGDVCKACGFEPSDFFDGIPSVIEVHHLTPLANIEAAAIYNPITDLIPLCPNCHRAIHKKKPIPYTLEELRALIKAQPT